MSSDGFRAVVLAGGRGSRLYPFTASLPKPLLPVGDHPVVELIVRRLAAFGASRITVAVNHLADLVQSYLGDGSRFGVPIDYVRETIPLGTAGPIGLVDPWTGPLLVMNGDVLTDIDFQDLLSSHRKHNASLTVATMIQSVRIESGVVETDASLRVTAIVEKPVVQHRLSIGMYVLSDHVADLIPRNERLEMPDLMTKLMGMGNSVVAHNHEGLWLDIGRPDDFAKAQADAAMWAKTQRTNGKAADFPQDTEHAAALLPGHR
jgi:NDP-mannose synthase